MSKQRTGGSSGSVIESMDNNIYFVPETAKIIIEKIGHNFPEKTNLILDACANDGVLGEAVYNWYRERGELIQVIYQDIKYKGYADKQIGGDILEYKPEKKFDIIICNPPWKPVTTPENIYHYLFNNILSENGILIYIIDLTFLYQGWERAIRLKYEKVYFLPRYTFNYGVNKKQKAAKTGGEYDTVLLDVGVMICPKKYQGNLFIHIPKDIKQRRFF